MDSQETLAGIYPRHRVVTVYSSEQFFAWTARDKAGEVVIHGLECGNAGGKKKKEDGRHFLYRLRLTEKCAPAEPLPPKPGHARYQMSVAELADARQVEQIRKLTQPKLL